MTAWLSVVMPVHGGARYLGATLASVVAEVAADAKAGHAPAGIDLRIYNSGGDDGARQVAEAALGGRLDFTWTDVPELKPWTTKTNLGVGEARADQVTMLHQDDLWRPGHLSALRAALAAAPAAAMSVAPSRFIGPDGAMLGHWRLPFAPGRHAGRDFAHTLLVQNSVAIPSPLIAREAWLACGGLQDDLWYTADWDLYLKLAQHGEIWVRPEATTAFRVHASSLTMTGSRNADAFRRQLEMVLERHLRALAPLPRGIEARARAGIEMNCALANAANGHPAGLLRALWRLAALGPVGAARFIGEARLLDRLRPRVALRLARGLQG